LSGAFVKALEGTETFSLAAIPPGVDAREFARNASGPFGRPIRILLIPRGFHDNAINGSLKVRINISYEIALIFYNQFRGFMNETTRRGLEQSLGQLRDINSTLPSQQASVTLIVDPSDSGSGIVRGIVLSVVDAFNNQLIGVNSVLDVKDETITTRRYQAADFYLPGLIAAFIMTNGVIGVTSTTSELRRRGILKRLSSTPLTKGEWIIGNILSQTTLSVMLTAVMIAVGWLVFRVTALPDIYAVVLILLGSMMFSGMGMVLAGLVKDVEAASAAGNAVAFPMMFLAGTFWPVELLPDYLQTIARFMPLQYFSDGLRDSLIFQYHEGVVYNTIIVAILALAFMVTGSLTTRWKEK
jgi:ABC-2 type transport system permease protein